LRFALSRNIMSYMRRDSRLSGVLHVLMHMADAREPMTSEKLAQAMRTNPVVVRRVMAGLREEGFVRSEKGHGGGWTIACDLAKTTLLDIHRAVGEPTLIALGVAEEAPGCGLEQAVNARLEGSAREAEQLLKKRLQEITLADLAADFSKLAHKRRSEGHAIRRDRDRR
jgi:DNA-binding IscR family transcriptional regulator